jgi:hypothetical protein
MPSYDEDFVEWTRHTAALLRRGRFDEVDVARVAEEVEDMGKRDRRTVESRLEVLLAHLLKWQWQPERRSGSWRATIRTQRSRIELTVRDSPSLRAEVPAMIARRYPKAVALASDQTGVAAARFPRRCRYGAAQVLDERFLPE